MKSSGFLIPSCLQKSLNVSLSNCFPLSKAKTLGILKREMMFFHTKLRTFFSVIVAKGSISTH